MSRWYRAYEGTVTDPKIGEAAMVAGCSKSIAIAAWHAILESAASTQDGGRFETTPRRVAVTLGEPLDLIEALFAAFNELKMASNGLVNAWVRRQFESDSSTERSRKLRERRKSDCNGDATLQGRAATPPDTEADTDTDTERTKPPQLEPEPPREAAAAWESGLEQKCREAAGLENDPSAALLVIGPIFDLIEAGWSLENHILPRLRALKASNRKGRSWAYYAKIITEEAKTPPKAQAPPTNGVYPVTESRTDFLARYAAKHGVSDDGKPSRP